MTNISSNQIILLKNILLQKDTIANGIENKSQTSIPLAELETEGYSFDLQRLTLCKFTGLTKYGRN